MDAALATHLASACATCGRRYVPARPRCAFCGSAVEPVALAARARVLACTRVHRAARGALMTAPYTVAWLQELEQDGGSVFLALVQDTGAPVVIGATVALEARTWETGGDAPFLGVVAVPEAG